ADDRVRSERRDRPRIHLPPIPLVDRAGHVCAGAFDPREDHAISGLDLRHACADLADDAAPFVSEAVREKLVLAAMTPALEHLRVADAADDDLYQCLTRLQCGN